MVWLSEMVLLQMLYSSFTFRPYNITRAFTISALIMDDYIFTNLQKVISNSLFHLWRMWDGHFSFLTIFVLELRCLNLFEVKFLNMRWPAKFATLIFNQWCWNNSGFWKAKKLFWNKNLPNIHFTYRVASNL